MQPKVGIVVVSYNAAVAVRTTLASLRAAVNATPSTLVLVDNASHEDERAQIRRALDRHVAATGLPWRHVQQEQNLGFAGGNNVGIQLLLQDPTITHVCLLNSDVIVPAEWLDRMLAPGLDIVSTVTNKAESEQCVPIDYRLSLDRCLDVEREALGIGVFEIVDDFARRWHRAFAGNVVDCDATFHCVLLTRRAIETIGPLDETFFPGGFEDDDYCIRARAAGFPVHLARDVFVHHWGSASFGLLRREYFGDNAARNRGYLEQKHGMTWRRRPEKPFVSFAQDADYALTGAGDRAAQRPLLSLYGKALDRLMAHYRREHEGLRNAAAAVEGGPPADITARMGERERAADIERRWRQLRRDLDAALERPDAPADQRLLLRARMTELSDEVHGLVDDTFAIHDFLETARADGRTTQTARPLWRRMWSLARHGVPFALRLRGVVFFGGYPYAAREQDGYYQRIRAIDGVFDDRWRIYFDPEPLPGQTQWYDLPAPRTLVLRPVGGRLRRWLCALVVTACAVRCRAVYFHSVLRMQDMGFGRLMRWPWLRKVIDVHGVVPEEFRMHADFYSALLFEAHERRAVRHARGVIVVTEAMRRYFRQKYRDGMRGEAIVLPIFPAMASYRQHKPLVDGRPVVVYAGGLHKWQQVPKMVAAILRTRESCQHRFYCTDPEAVAAMFPVDALAGSSLVIERKSHEELVECYRECHYGFVLREDSVVNHVACPTKVIEYLAMGIVPILDTQSVGDFVDLGMRFVALEDFVAGRLPSAAERDAMAQANFEVFGRLRAQREAGVARLRELFGGGVLSGSLTSRTLWRLAKLFPAGTMRGTFARRVWRMSFGRRPRPTRAVAADSGPGPAPCDVLVQVGNFFAGGLENAVLDLNAAFAAAGLRVSMLVLGEAGPAVARAREQGVPVCLARYSDDAYRRWLQAATPKLVMSHYSVDGAAICGEQGVPLVQVIHNIYLWLDGAELAAMRDSAAHTTTFVAASSFARDYSVRRLGVPDDRCAVIPYGIDVRRFRDLDVTGERARLRANLGIAADQFVFLNVGAINYQKNHLSQLRAFQAVAAECPDARLVVVGPSYEHELLNDCRRYAERNGLGDRITFTGAVSDPHRYYAMADALVHSAFFEGGPLALIEGLAANLPIVTVATGLAIHFEGCRGVHVIPAHFDVAAFQGHITAMKPSAETERQMATAMLRVYRERVRPDLPASFIELFDRENAYRLYVELVRNLIEAPTATYAPRRAWPELVPNAG